MKQSNPTLINRYNKVSGSSRVSWLKTPQRRGRLIPNALLSILLIVVLLGVNQQVFAQGKTVSGKVIAADDNYGLPGVNVTLKGTTTGTVTDVEGNYSLSVPSDDATLVFSYIGYETQEVTVGNRSTINLTLQSDAKALNEVVVIGYGTQEKKDATGGVVALGPRDYNKGVIASPEQLLQGRAAGVQITPASGEPGAGVNIRIRGTTSIRGGNNPLFVVDGIPLDGGNTTAGGQDFGAGSQSPRNPLTFLNPADIENITVLKDASAAAIYGARGANGVVLITTRSGKTGQQTLNFSTSASTSSTLRRYNLLEPNEFLRGLADAGGDATDPVIAQSNNTDWQEEIFRTGISQNYNLDFGGGNENTRYYFSVGYSDQQGIIETSGLKRLSGRINASHELFEDRIKLELNLTTSGVRDNFVPLGDNAGAQGNLIGAALQSNPSFPVRNPNGTYYTPGGDYRNPVAMINLIDDKGNTSRTLGRLSASWNIISGLTYKFNLGLDNANSVRRTAIARGVPGFAGDINVGTRPFEINTGLNPSNGFANIQNRFQSNLLLEHTLTFNRKIGASALDVLAGFAYQNFENRGNYTMAGNFLPDVANTDIPLYDLILGVNNQDNKSYFAGSDRGRNELQSYFGRINYNINDRYILTGTLRVDGSSRFGRNNKYGYFPSIAAAWRLSEESFVPELFSDLKLRLNWGITGNQEYPGNTSRVIFGFNPQNAAATAQNNPNPNIRWEQTQQYGAGLDFGFMDGRLTGTVDYFKKGTKDLIFQAFQAQPAAAIYRWVNLPGNINNEGAEFTLNYDVLRDREFNWNVGYNMTYITTNVTGIGTIINTGQVNGQGLSGAFAQQIRDGYPVGAFFLREFAGYNENGFGVYPNGELLTYQGNAIPKWNFGLNNSFSYGNWDLSFFLNASAGFFVYNNTANAYFIKGNLRNGRNVTTDVINSVENADNFAEASSRFLERGDFIRLTNFSLGHNFQLPASKYVKSLRLFLTGQNVFLLTNYTGIDPEVNTNKAIDGVPSIGIDYTAFPSARTFTLGLNAGF